MTIPKTRRIWMTYFGTLNKITPVGYGETFAKSLPATMFLLDSTKKGNTSTPLPGLPNPNHYPRTSRLGTTVKFIMPVSYATWTEPPTYEDLTDDILMMGWPSSANTDRDLTV